MDGPRPTDRGPAVVPGGASQIEIASSLQAVIRDHRAAQQEYTKTLQTMRTEADMMARFGGFDEQKIATAVAAGVRAAIGGGTPSAPAVTPMAHDVPSPPSEAAQESVAAARRAAQRAQAEQDAALERHREALRPKDFKEGQKNSLNRIYQLAADRVATNAQQWTFGGATIGDINMSSDFGDFGGQVRLDTGAMVGEDEAHSLAQRMAAADAVRRLMARAGGAESLSAGMKAAFPKITQGMDYAGLGVGAGLAVANFAQDQREANLEYQRVLGGSNAEGFGERINEQLFQWRAFLGSGMNNRTAETLYRGALDLAPHNDYARGQMMDEGLDLYRSIGMDPKKWLDIIKTAIENSNWGIRQIGEALEGVTETAREAGLNAEEARSQFSSAFQSMSQIVIGPGATQAAQVATQGNLALGRIGEGLEMTPNQLMQYQVAGRLGVDLNRANAMLGGSGTDQRAYWSAVEGVMQDFSQGLITPEGQAIVDEQIRQSGGGYADLTPREVEDIVRRLQYEGGIAPIGAVQARWQAQGMNLSADEAVRQTLLAQYGGFQYDEQAGQVNEATGPQAGVLSEDDILQIGNLNGIETTPRNIDDMVSGNEGDLGGKERALALYSRAVRMYGQRLPFIETMLNNYGSEGDARFTVQTAGGQVVVGLHELLRDFYPQAMAGHVEVVGNSSYSGQSTSQILGSSAESLAEHYGGDFEEQLHANEEQDYTGRTFDAEDLGGENATTVRLYVEPGPRLSEFFTFTSAGNNRVDFQYGSPSTTTMPSTSAPHG